MASTTAATVRVRFFARYAELVGRSEAAVSVPLPATVRDVLHQLRDDVPGARALPQQPLAAVNLKQVRLDTSVHDGDEVALLPPIAGGSPQAEAWARHCAALKGSNSPSPPFRVGIPRTP